MDIKEDKFRQAYAEVAKTDKRALAELIVEYIDPQHVALDVVGMLLDTRALNPGDALVKKVRRGIEVRQLIPGQTTLSSQINVKDLVNFNLDAYYAQVMASEWDLEVGEIGTAESIRAEMFAKISDYFVAKVFASMSTLATVNTPAGWAFAGATITRAALEDMIDHINDVAGGVKMIIGRRTALAPITKFAGYRTGSATDGSAANMVAVPSALEEIRRTGWFGTYYGCNFLALNQTWDNEVDRNPLIPNDIILVIGNNCGEFITYGPPRVDQWTDITTAPPNWYLRIYQQFGMLFDKMQNIGIIQLS